MTVIIHKHGSGKPDKEAFTTVGELLVDTQHGKVYTLTDRGTVVDVSDESFIQPPDWWPRNHTMYAKAEYTTDTAVATDRFQALKYDMTPYHSSIGQYTYGFKFGKRFGTDDTTGLEWSLGCFVELYNSDGQLVFAAEADEVVHNEDETLTISWHDQSKLYKHGLAGRHGDTYLVKVGNLGGTVVRQSTADDREPPPDE